MVVQCNMQTPCQKAQSTQEGRYSDILGMTPRDAEAIFAHYLISDF